MKNISRLFIILLAIVFLLLAGNVVPSQAATSLVMDEYGTGFYNANDGTGWHEWPSEMTLDPFGNVLPMFAVPVMDLPAPYYLDIVAVENGITIDSAEISKIMGGDLTDVSDVVRLVDWPLLAPLFPPDYPGPYFGLYVLYSNNSDGVNAPADVGLTNLIPISPITPFIPGFIVNEQLNGTFSVTFPDGTTLLAYSKGHAAATIDIKPGSFPNFINPSNKGVIPVAILGSSTFDVTQVNYSTVCFVEDCTIEAHGVHFEDVNGDGFIDAILHFDTRQTNIKRGDTQACLGGQLNNGLYFAGCDSVRTVPR